MEKETKPKATRKKTEKKELTPYELIYAEFQSDLNDKELQERYDRFKRTREAAKERHNAKIPEINSLVDQHNQVTNLIVQLAVNGIDTSDAVKKFKESQSKIEEIRIELDKEKAIMAEEDALIKKYEQDSEKKFFHYWKMFRVLDPNTPAWYDWYHKQYKGMII